MSFEDFFKKAGRDMSHEQEKDQEEISRHLNEQPITEYDPVYQWELLEQLINDHLTMLDKTRTEMLELREMLAFEKHIKESLDNEGISTDISNNAMHAIRELQPYLIQFSEHIKELKRQQARIELLIPDDPELN